MSMDLNTVELLFGHTDEDSAYLVEDYPYGRRVRTQARFWLETVPKRGDRFCKQTLNPRTGVWNKPKKSTYSDIGVMYLDQDERVQWFGIGTWPTKEDLAHFCGVIGTERLNEQQRLQLAKVIGRTRAFEHVTFKVQETTSQTDEERAAHKADQDEKEKKIWALAALEARKAHKNLQG